MSKTFYQGENQACFFFFCELPGHAKPNAYLDDNREVSFNPTECDLNVLVPRVLNLSLQSRQRARSGKIVDVEGLVHDGDSSTW